MRLHASPTLVPTALPDLSCCTLQELVLLFQSVSFFYHRHQGRSCLDVLSPQELLMSFLMREGHHLVVLMSLKRNAHRIFYGHYFYLLSTASALLKLVGLCALINQDTCGLAIFTRWVGERRIRLKVEVRATSVVVQ